MGALLPKPNALAQVQTGDILTELGDQTFDTIIYRRRDNGWGVAQSLKRAASFWKAEPVAGSIAERSRAWFAAKLRGGSAEPVHMQGLLRHVKAVAFDITEEKRDLTRELQAALRGAHWFSLPHGIDLKAWKWGRRPVGEMALGKARHSKVKVYALGQADASAYRSAYALADSDIAVVGVPRHALNWINRLQEDSAVPYERYILLISRPHKDSCFPLERKIQALADIKKLCNELQLKIVVRLHPRETHDGLYESVFEKDRFGTHWTYSSSHPFALGRSAEFCISFFSSVAVDMVAIGVPVIERCDFAGLTEAHELVRDARGDPASTYQLLGLALGAKDYGELRGHALRIMSDRDGVVKQLRAAYVKVYASHPDPVGAIADDIDRCLPIRHRCEAAEA
jgi:hypothetical protein